MLVNISKWESLDVFMPKGKLEKEMVKGFEKEKSIFAHLFMKIKEIRRKGR